MDIGSKIISRRKELHLTQKELAKKVGISQNAMCSIEKGKAKPSYSTLEDLCAILRMSMVFVYDEETGIV